MKRLRNWLLVASLSINVLLTSVMWTVDQYTPNNCFVEAVVNRKQFIKEGIEAKILWMRYEIDGKTYGHAVTVYRISNGMMAFKDQDGSILMPLESFKLEEIVTYIATLYGWKVTIAFYI